MAVIADPVSAVSSLLDDNWSTAAGNGGTKPTIGDSWDLGKKNVKNADLVRVYEVGGSHDFTGVGNGLDKGNWRISIDMATASDRTRLRQIYGEVLRLLRSNQGSPGTDYAFVKPMTRVDHSDRLRRWYRYVLDCEIVSYEAVS